MQICEHHITLIYPFKHQLDRRSVDGNSGSEGDTRGVEGDNEPMLMKRMKTLSSRWNPWWNRKSPDLFRRSLDDTFFFLPHVRYLIYPETKTLTSEGPLNEDPMLVRQRVKELVNLPMEEWAAQIGANGVQRMTLKTDSALGFRSVSIRQSLPEGEEISVDAELDWVDAVLFPQRVGFLLFRMRLPSRPTALTTEALGNLIYLARMIHPPNLRFQLPVWRAQRGDRTIEFHGRDLVEYLVSGMTMESDLSADDFAARLSALRKDDHVARYYNTPEGQILGESMRWMVYSCLDQETRGWQTSDEAQALRPSFSTPGDWLAWELTSLMPVTFPENRPRFEEFQDALAPLRFRRWENWSGLAQHESVAMVGEFRSHWTQETLPATIDADYLPLYLLTQYQYIRLSSLAGEIQSQHSDLSKDHKQTRKHLAEFFAFQNLYWFTEPTGRSQGIELYQMFHRALGLPRLFESIRQELTDLSEFFESETSKLTQTALERIQRIGFAIAVASLLLSLASLVVATLTWTSPHRFDPVPASKVDSPPASDQSLDSQPAMPPDSE